MVSTEEMLPRLQQAARGIVRKASHRDEGADEATAYIMAKVAEVLAEFESGARARPATNMSGYMYRAMQNALIDWQRQLAKEASSPLTQDESAWIEREAGGHELRGGFRAYRPKISLPPPRPKRRPFLLWLLDRATSSLRYDFEDDAEGHDGIRRGRGRASPTEFAAHRALGDVSCWSDRGLCHPSASRDDIAFRPPCMLCPVSQPWRVAEEVEARLVQLTGRDSEGVRLYLSGIREAEIARRLGIKPPSVTELLGRVCQKWGADRQGLAVEQMRLLFANLFMVVEGALRPFRPREEQDDLALPRLDRARGERTEGPRRPDQLQIEWRLAREGAAYKAISSCPALGAWIRGLELDHMPEIIALVEDCYYPEMTAT
jgi:DNA-binding CsgD family transcriptional regulator